VQNLKKDLPILIRDKHCVAVISALNHVKRHSRQNQTGHSCHHLAGALALPNLSSKYAMECMSPIYRTFQTEPTLQYELAPLATIRTAQRRVPEATLYDSEPTQIPTNNLNASLRPA
jgi:hypothetical protein